MVVQHNTPTNKSTEIKVECNDKIKIFKMVFKKRLSSIIENKHCTINLYTKEGEYVKDINELNGRVVDVGRSFIIEEGYILFGIRDNNDMSLIYKNDESTTKEVIFDTSKGHTFNLIINPKPIE